MRRKKNLAYLAVILSVAAVLAGCEDAPSGSAGTGDASARNACGHFRNVVRDAGILTDAELREKLKEVDRSASVSDVFAVRAASRAMLSNATSGDADAFGVAVLDMSSGCSSIGQ